MALGIREHSTWLRFKEGAIHWSKGGTSGICDYVEGVITGVKYQDREFEWQGKKIHKRELVIDIQDGSDKYSLTDGVDSNSGIQLQNKLLNTDVGETIRISPSKKDDVRDGKPVVVTSGVFINVNNESIKQKYNKDNPGNMPDWNKVRVNGKDVWDKTAQIEFLEQEMLEHFKNAKAVEVASTSGEFHESEIPSWDDSSSGGDTGDTPF